MDEDELDKLKEERLSQLEESKGEEEQVEDQRQQIKQRASQHLTKEARSRLGNIRTAKPELASQIEAQVATLGETGRIDKIDDEQLKNILKEIQGEDDETDIKFRR